MTFQLNLMASLVGSFRRLAGMDRRAACLLIAASAVGIVTCGAAADPNYIANLTFSDHSPGSARAKPFDSVLRPMRMTLRSPHWRTGAALGGFQSGCWCGARITKLS